MPRPKIAPTDVLRGLTLRHRTYFARVRVPQDLRAALGHSVLSQTTGEQDPLRAAIKARPILAEMHQRIDTARKGPRKPVEAPVSSLASALPRWMLRALTPAPISFLDHVDAWEAQLSLKGRPRAQYVTDVRAYPNLSISRHEMTPDRCQDWVDKRGRAGDANKTIMRRLSALRNYSRWLARTMKVPEPEMALSKLHMPSEARKGPDTKRRALTRGQVDALWAAASHDEPLQSLIALAAYTGGRIEELCKLTVMQVDLTEWTLHLSSKTDAGDRLVPVHTLVRPLVARLVRDAQAGPKQAPTYLIHSTASNQYGERSVPLGKRFGRLKTSMGHDGTLVFHSIRKTVATLMKDAGCPEAIAADVLGHEIQTMSYGVYAEGSSMATRREWVEKALVYACVR